MNLKPQELPDDSITEDKLARRLSARIGALFSSVSEMLENTDLDYSAISAGDTLLAQGFRYAVVAETAEPHLVTAGGLKLRVLPDVSERLSLAAFGADPSGSEDSLPALQKAAIAANEAQSTLVARGRFKLSHDGLVELTTDCDFSGAIFDCSTWSGRFVFGRKHSAVTYGPDSPVVRLLMASQDLEVGSSRFSGWFGRPEVSDSFVIIYTEQDFYTYRSETKKRIELNRVYKDGVVSSPLRYSLAGVAISSVKVLRMEDRRCTVKGLTLDIRNNTISNEYVRVSTSLLDLDVRFIQDENIYTPRNPTYIYFFECCQVKARTEMQWAIRNENFNYAYNFQLNTCYDIEITPHADGEGWGATGNNLCQRVTLRDGVLSRVDFHQPFMEWLRLRNMVVGHSGILVTALGNLDLDTVTFHARSMASRSDGFVKGRGDTGGFCDGDLLMRNIKIISNRGVGDLELLLHTQSLGTSKPAGTPIEYRFWRRITVDGLEYRSQLNVPQRLWVRPGKIQLTDASIAVCEELTVHNAHGSGLNVDVNLDDRLPSKESMFALKLDLENIVGETISIQGNNPSFQVIASIRNCRGFGQEDGIAFEPKAPGEYTLTGGCVSRIDCSGTRPSTAPAQLQAYGTVIVDANDDHDLITAGQNCDIRLIDCTFRVPVQDRLATLLGALLERPRFFINGARKVWPLGEDLHGKPGNLELPHPPREGQKIRLVMGYTSNSTATEVELLIPAVGGRTVFAGFHEDDEPGLGILHRTAEATLAVSGRVWFRYIRLG
ncbi:hypothetical protein SAMN03159443_03743 [Pseudomonas sp. NFACC15-1]|uniref:hypothetical protein n=1 Tax=unclassified Pseudomonas TaxID=196821 RepID=UPI00088EF1D6|nr:MULTISPECIES: hypothetical protein [unclassified Pseudomonas]SDA85530.1 hypothetical protein SAMN03159443_03743 [Pseudomonas sp. NFACC15-1]SDW66785.1 hypothetical protein SAMN03159380_00952 [Pseudomonas sp. NFACC14]